MTRWASLAMKGLAIAVLILPVILALLSPDGFQWGDGKGGHK